MNFSPSYLKVIPSAIGTTGGGDYPILPSAFCTVQRTQEKAFFPPALFPPLLYACVVILHNQQHGVKMHHLKNQKVVADKLFLYATNILVYHRQVYNGTTLNEESV